MQEAASTFPSAPSSTANEFIRRRRTSRTSLPTPNPGSPIRWRSVMTQFAPPSFTASPQPKRLPSPPRPLPGAIESVAVARRLRLTLPGPMPSSGSVSRSRRGRPMASRNFDGKVALLFREGRGLSAPWRHLADSGHTAGQQSTWAEREEEAEWAVRNWALGRDSGKHYVSQRRWRLGRGAGSRSEQTGSEAPPSELGFPGCTASGGCARTLGAGALARPGQPPTGDSISQGPAA